MAKRSAADIKLILLLGLLSAFGPMTIDMYLPAFPAMAREFGVKISVIQYTLAAFNIGIAAGQLFYGTLADQVGRRINLLIGMSLYTLASIGCALAPSADSLIGLRLLQALGGCTGMVITRAIVRDRFAGDDSARVFSLLILIMGIAPILAPSVGTLLITYFSWQSIFWLLSGLGLLALLLIFFSLPETLPVEKRNPHALRQSFRTYYVLLRDRRFMGYALTGGMLQAGLFAYITGSAFVFLNLYHFSSQQYGILFGANAGGLILASQLNNYLLKRFHFKKILRRVVAFNFLSATVMALLAYFGWFSFYGFAVPLFFCIASVGFVLPNSTAGALNKQSAHAGAASAMLGTLSFGCGALAAVAVSAMGTGSALPVAAVILLCSGISWLALHRLAIKH